MGIFLVNGCNNQTEKDPRYAAHVPVDEKVQICWEVESYSVYCRNNGILSAECAKQLNAKLKKVYGYSDSQLENIYECCTQLSKDSWEQRQDYDAYAKKLGKRDSFDLTEREKVYALCG